MTRQVPAAALPGLGISPESRGWVAIATLDSFGDKVPPRMLSLMRDGAWGRQRREGAPRWCSLLALW
jgi:hypothetical protein